MGGYDMTKKKVRTLGEYMFGKGSTSRKAKMPAHLKALDAKMMDKLVHRKSRKVEPVVDEKPDWGLLMPKFPSHLI